MRHTSSSAFAIVVAVAGMFAVGATFGAPAAVLAQTGQKTSGTAGKTTEPTYTVCTPSASNNNCKGSKSVGMADPGGGGEAPDAGCAFNGKCTQASVSSGDLNITVAPGFTNMVNVGTLSGPAQMALAAQPAPYYATLSVTHKDVSSCEKIYQIVVNTEWNGGHVDIAHANVPNGGECNFSNFTFRFQPMSIGEVQKCPAGGVLKTLHVVLMSHNMWGQLTKDDNSDTYTTARVFVSCPKLTPSAVAVSPVTYRGACPAGVAVTGSYDANGNGAMSTVWHFGNGSIVHGSSTAKAGHNTVGLAPAHVTASVSTTVSLSVAGPGGTVISPAVPYEVHCNLPSTAAAAAPKGGIQKPAAKPVAKKPLPLPHKSNIP